MFYSAAYGKAVFVFEECCKNHVLNPSPRSFKEWYTVSGICSEEHDLLTDQVGLVYSADLWAILYNSQTFRVNPAFGFTGTTACLGSKAFFSSSDISQLSLAVVPGHKQSLQGNSFTLRCKFREFTQSAPTLQNCLPRGAALFVFVSDLPCLSTEK